MMLGNNLGFFVKSNLLQLLSTDLRVVPVNVNHMITFEFKTMPSDEMFDEIDKMVATGKTGWKRDGNKYSFSVTWGNGFPTPKGEWEEDDGMFSITITRGEKEGMITHGAW